MNPYPPVMIPFCKLPALNWRSVLWSIVLILVIVGPAGAATFPVRSGEDMNDLAPGNGLCVALLKPIPLPSFVFLLPICTLRAAVEEANAYPGEDSIVLGAGTFTLSIPGTGEDQTATGDLDVTESVRIIGAGTNKTIIDANGLDRALDILGAGTRVTLSNLTVINGNLPSGQVLSQKGGGGIRNRGELILDTVVVRNNTVGGVHSGDMGGGILNQGMCTVTGSTIADNQAVLGGGIMNESQTSLYLNASTIMANSARSGAGLMNKGSAFLKNSTLSSNRAQGEIATGGALYNQEQLQLIHCTIADNAAGYGGGLGLAGGTVSMVNTLLADNEGGNCDAAGLVSSEGNNLDSDNTCGLGPFDLKNIDAKLGLLRENGGPTQTYSLNPGSPAIDTGKSLTDIRGDQRGVVRPQRKAYDIGAFEVGEISVAPLITPLLF